MQSTVPDVMEIDKETKKTQEMYGIGETETDTFGRQCLMARRFAEAGVRFIEIAHTGWDQHTGLQAKHAANAKAVDKPIAGLLADLKQRRSCWMTLWWSGAGNLGEHLAAKSRWPGSQQSRVYDVAGGRGCEGRAALRSDR